MTDNNAKIWAHIGDHWHKRARSFRQFAWAYLTVSLGLIGANITGMLAPTLFHDPSAKDLANIAKYFATCSAGGIGLTMIFVFFNNRNYADTCETTGNTLKNVGTVIFDDEPSKDEKMKNDYLRELLIHFKHSINAAAKAAKMEVPFFKKKPPAN